MNIRTVSQLASADVDLQSWIGMSVPVNPSSQQYQSRKVKLENVEKHIIAATSADMQTRYGLADSQHQPINVKQIYDYTQALNNGIAEFSGMKIFNDWPYISADFSTMGAQYGENGEFAIPNVKKVKQLVEDNAMLISTTDSEVAEGNPLPLQIQTDSSSNTVLQSLDYANTIGSGKFYYWHIDDNQTDSSNAVVDRASGSTGGYEEMRDNGNLVAWGWLTEDAYSTPLPEQCWVALVASIKCENYNNTQFDIPIQVVPWIRGKNSTALQYVGFNAPVRKGLRLKVKTGFKVSGQNSGFQRPGSLTFLDQGVSNAFFGYIIK